jgi:FlaG/FlaF family flagellin (archaellin)
MMMIMKNRKGISTFIATLLLMVLAVAAGVIIYAYTMGYLGGFGNPNTMGAMSIDSSGVDATTGDATIFIRNIGKTSLTIDKVYVDGVEMTVTAHYTALDFTAADPLAENAVGELVILQEGFDEAASTAGTKTFEVKVICADNTQISFNIKATATG